MQNLAHVNKSLREVSVSYRLISSIKEGMEVWNGYLYVDGYYIGSTETAMSRGGALILVTKLINKYVKK